MLAVSFGEQYQYPFVDRIEIRSMKDRISTNKH